MPIEYPSNFSIRDLMLDVSLTAAVDGSCYDFMGRSIFSTSFYRNNIGFGIEDINIDR